MGTCLSNDMLKQIIQKANVHRIHVLFGLLDMFIICLELSD